MNDPHRELRAMIESASQWADDQFAVHGLILPMWHILSGSGKNMLLPAPPYDKDISAAIMREALKIFEAIRYVFMDEAWVVEFRGDEAVEEAAKASDLSTHPRRVEVVMFSGEDHAGELLGKRRIERPAKGKAYLGPLEFEEYKVSEGRLVGMLPQRGARN
jgi:hypothetical protein